MGELNLLGIQMEKTEDGSLEHPKGANRALVRWSTHLPPSALPTAFLREALAFSSSSI